MGRLLLTALALVGAASLAAQGAGAGGGIASRPVLDNATVAVTHVSLDAGARESPHTHPAPTFVVQLSRGIVDMQNGESRGARVREPGDVEFIDRDAVHAAANAGTGSFAVAAVSLKPGRPRGGSAAPPTPPPGVTRRPLIENAEAAVTRVDFSPSAREPLHSHPFDLVVVPVRGALIALQRAGVTETRGYAAGEAIFIPRNETHAMANPSSESFAVVALAIK